MKRSIFLFILFLTTVLIPAPRTAASAADDGTYAVATGEVWFYAAADEEEKLFLLPETYYVRVLDAGGTFCTVEYLTDDAPYRKLLGYCRTDALTFVDFVPARPYLRKQITVTYTLPDSGSLGSDEFTKFERTFVYYGDRYDGGQLYLYVLSGETGDPSAEGAPANAVQIVVIVLACVAAVAVAVILLRGKKPPREQQEF